MFQIKSALYFTQTPFGICQVLLNYNETLQKKFLLFTTGSDRVPVGGMAEMTFKISKLKVGLF